MKDKRPFNKKSPQNQSLLFSFLSRKSWNNFRACKLKTFFCVCFLYSLGLLPYSQRSVLISLQYYLSVYLVSSIINPRTYVTESFNTVQFIICKGNILHSTKLNKMDTSIVCSILKCAVSKKSNKERSGHLCFTLYWLVLC